jgi:hypothetical protein
MFPALSQMAELIFEVTVSQKIASSFFLILAISASVLVLLFCVPQ